LLDHRDESIRVWVCAAKVAVLFAQWRRVGIALVGGVVAQDAEFVGKNIDFGAVLRVDPEVAAVGEIRGCLDDKIVALALEISSVYIETMAFN
jgi:hypothetical protein